MEIQTNGRRPEKIPVPPRIWVVLSPEISQLNPNRGDQSGFTEGNSLTSGVMLSPPRGFGIERLRASTAGLEGASILPFYPMDAPSNPAVDALNLSIPGYCYLRHGDSG